MDFSMRGAEIFVPDGTAAEKALERTTHMAIAAHQDDIEIMAYDGILKAFGRRDRHFTGVVVTNGGKSPRSGIYADYSDEEMMAVRRREQKKAALVGEYGAQVLLDYPSGAVKDPSDGRVGKDLKTLVSASKPGIIYTHNLADRHDTHVAVALRVIAALRELAPQDRPEKLYGCEVWRDLDWMPDRGKVKRDVSGRPNLRQALLEVFDSQICGGKRYDLATAGRWTANATYAESHATDGPSALSFAMDLTPLIEDAALDVSDYVNSYIRAFEQDVLSRIKQFN